MRLLCVAIKNQDLQSVHYLLKEAQVSVPEEPSNTHPAILAAYYGHTALVKELLDSLAGSLPLTPLTVYVFHNVVNG